MRVEEGYSEFNVEVEHQHLPPLNLFYRALTVRQSPGLQDRMGTGSPHTFGRYNLGRYQTVKVYTHTEKISQDKQHWEIREQV